MRFIVLAVLLAASPAVAQTENILTGGEYIGGATQSGGKEKFLYGRRGPKAAADGEKAVRDNFFYGGYGEPVGQVFTDQGAKD